MLDNFRRGVDVLDGEALVERFDDYTDYAATTGRFFPGW